MSIKLFVGNLPAGCRQEDLENVFAQYGAITECTIMGSYGFVHMAGQTEAQAAITSLNGYNLMGSDLSVELSKPGVGKKTGKGIPDRTGLTKIFIGNVKEGTTDEELKSLFETYGEVAESDVCGGFGFIHMKEHASALKAIKSLKGYLLNGNRLNIELSTKATQGRSKSGPEEFRFDDFSGSPYVRGGFQGRIARGRGMVSPRFDPYKTGGQRRPLLDDYNPNSMYPSPSRPPLLPNVPGQGVPPGIAKELVEFYLKNPAAFDRYARDPVVHQYLNINLEDDASNVDPYYRPPREYYEKNKMPGDPIEMMPVTYPTVPMPGMAGIQGPGNGMHQPVPYPPVMGPRLQRMPGSGNGSHLYTSFE